MFCKSKIFNKKQSFTLIELLVVLFIFSVVLVITNTSFIRIFILGMTTPSGQKETISEISALNSLIAQKASEANYNSTESGQNIKGISCLGSSGPLVFAKKNSDTSAATCTFFKFAETSSGSGHHDPGNPRDHRIVMLENNCLVIPSDANFQSSASRTDTRANTSEFRCEQISDSPPVVKVTIKAEPGLHGWIETVNYYTVNYPYSF